MLTHVNMSMEKSCVIHLFEPHPRSNQCDICQLTGNGLFVAKLHRKLLVATCYYYLFTMLVPGHFACELYVEFIIFREIVMTLLLSRHTFLCVSVPYERTFEKAFTRKFNVRCFVA